MNELEWTRFLQGTTFITNPSKKRGLKGKILGVSTK
jgi:hypothetical protein